VIIQTYTPEHYAIVAAAKQDYTAFYQQELQHRQSYGNPPFSRLIRLLYTDTNPVRCQRETNKMYLRLREEIMAKGIPDISLLGPSPAFHSRIRGKFRWHLIVRGTDPLRLLAELPLPPGWTVDVDPVTLL
jgi:primosomal protein N' (replication factor Y)